MLMNRVIAKIQQLLVCGGKGNRKAELRTPGYKLEGGDVER